MPIIDALRVSRRALRALLGRDLFYRRQVAAPRLHLGEPGASWCLCPRRLRAESVMYSFGVGVDLSFELAVIENYGMQVHAFEPTPRSLDWIRSQDLPSQLVIHEYGVATWDGTAHFTPPSHPAHVSYSMVRGAADRPAISAPVYRLATIAARLGHTHLDVLKMDIEGAEYDVLPDCLSSALRIDQILVEFHHRWDSIGVARTRDAIAALQSSGYRIADVSPSGCEYAFLRTGEDT